MAEKERNNVIVASFTPMGNYIKAGRKVIYQGKEPREAAAWKGAIKQLEKEDLIELERKHGQYYQLTSKGYEIAEKLEKDSQQ